MKDNVLNLHGKKLGRAFRMFLWSKTPHGEGRWHRYLNFEECPTNSFRKKDVFIDEDNNNACYCVRTFKPIKN